MLTESWLPFVDQRYAKKMDELMPYSAIFGGNLEPPLIQPMPSMEHLLNYETTTKWTPIDHQ